MTQHMREQYPARFCIEQEVVSTCGGANKDDAVSQCFFYELADSFDISNLILTSESGCSSAFSSSPHVKCNHREASGSKAVCHAPHESGTAAHFCVLMNKDDAYGVVRTHSSGLPAHMVRVA